MADGPAELRIVRVDLAKDSMKTARELAGDHSDLYPVMVWFSRPTNAFERMAIQEELDDLVFDNDDSMCAVKFNTTLEAIDSELELIHANIDNAVANAHTDRENANREDARLEALRDSLNIKLQKRT